MSKLDKVEYEIYTGVPPEFADGSYKCITDKTRNQIKAIFLEIIREAHSEANGHDFESILRRKIGEL